MKVLRKFFNSKKSNDPITAEERFLIKKCIRDGDVVFDVGAHHGLWSQEVLKAKTAKIHAFEASGDAFSVLEAAIGDRVTLNRNAVTNRNEELVFYVYRDDARLSSLHRRASVEDELCGKGFDEIRVPGTTLDTYWEGREEQIRFLKVDVEAAEYDALRGAGRLLRTGQIDFVQFEYGGTFFDAGTTLRNVWSYLRRYDYHVLRIKGSKLIEVKTSNDVHEDYKYSNYLAVHARLMKVFTGKGKEITLDFERMAFFDIHPKGALHVGGHQGDEIVSYRKQNVSPVVFVEANPELAEGLRARFAKDHDVKVIEAAASDHAGKATFNITSMDQSSSLLPLKDHSKLYPKIEVAKQITVRTDTLDALLARHGVAAGDIDFIAMDIQGAELMALVGAKNLLQHVKALQLEVNYAQLYEGCPLISELDAYLADFGFIRVMTNTPYNEEWGDALYVKRPLVTCSSVGQLGRFANHVFQYAFLQCYAEDHGYVAANGPWAGDDIFDLAKSVKNLPNMPNNVCESGYELSDSSIVNDPDVRPATDFTGFFQYHTRYYKPHKELIQSHLSFKGEYAEQQQRLSELFSEQTGPVVTVHLRRGDFGTGIFFIAPEIWYVDWLTKLREANDSLTVYVASDDLGAVLPAFSQFNVLTAQDVPGAKLDHEFSTDFAALTLGDHLAISNSSFSFAASMLNNKAQSFMRPDLIKGGLVSYDPWNAPVLLRHAEAEDAGEEFLNQRAKSRSKYKIKKLIKTITRQ